MSSSGERYERAMRRVVMFTADLDDRRQISATPAWTLRDVLAHVVGVAVDVANGDVEDYAQPRWTNAQVVRRATRPRAVLLEEWEDVLPRIAETLDAPERHGLDPVFSRLPLIDLLAHEHDIRESAATFDFADRDVWPTVEQRRRDVLSAQLDLTNLGGLLVRTAQGDEWQAGSAGPAVTVRADRYRLWRSLEGRRSKEDVRAFEWSSDPTPYLAHWLGLPLARRRADSAAPNAGSALGLAAG